VKLSSSLPQVCIRYFKATLFVLADLLSLLLMLLTLLTRHRIARLAKRYSPEARVSRPSLISVRLRSFVLAALLHLCLALLVKEFCSSHSRMRTLNFLLLYVLLYLYPEWNKVEQCIACVPTHILCQALS
jgi:hypothetical protein